VTVALKEGGQDTDDDRRRFKVVFKLAYGSDKKRYIDLETIDDFCQSKKQSLQQKDEMVRFAIGILIESALSLASPLLAHCNSICERPSPR